MRFRVESHRALEDTMSTECVFSLLCDPQPTDERIIVLTNI